MSNSKVANMNIKLKELFFKWMEITRPFHGLNNQQQQVLALLLYYHYQYRKDITNNKILWRVLFDYDTKLKIKEDDVFEKGLSDSALQTILTNLRKKKVIINNEISKVYIPELDLKSKNFKIIFNFNIIDNES